MGKIIDLTGQRFGRLTVLSRAEDYVDPHGNHRIKWLCRCDCGNKCEILSIMLRNGGTRSCGCLRRETSRDKASKNNEYIIFDDHAEIILNSGHRALIDVEDVEFCKKHYWYENDQGYVLSNGDDRGKNIRLHRLLMHIENDSSVVDHINGNPLDNRKQNLRICNRGDNQKNMKGHNGYPGVSFEKGVNKWRVRIRHNGKNLHVGVYNTEEEAIEARIRAEEKYYGEYGYYNSRIKNKEENNLWEENLVSAT